MCMCVINANPRLLRRDLEHHHRREMNRLGGGLRYKHLEQAEIRRYAEVEGQAKVENAQGIGAIGSDQ